MAEAEPKENEESNPADVIFCSVSHGKDHGLVQFSTVGAAQTAMRSLRHYPLDGHVLYARPDVQERRGDDRVNDPPRQSSHNDDYSVIPTATSGETAVWKCADPQQEAASTSTSTITTLLATRDAARRRRNYRTADAMREHLRNAHGVQLDDRLQLWWYSSRSGGDTEQQQQPWRHIAVPEWDDQVLGSSGDSTADAIAHLTQLLHQRDAARRRREFGKADALLEQVVQAPTMPGVSIRVHDESRTWRVWVEGRRGAPGRADERPSKSHHSNKRADKNNNYEEEEARRACLSLVHTQDPSKVREVLRLLARYPASSVLPRLQQRMTSSSSSSP